ncbi:caspase family protein [Tautonia plasticadhaerens]|uniref:Caspase domain protein n=1 Tax=Tautonia plasticadhaerens TaxID=2527974 RepID=A0A518H9H8_9BACT|nr:caspase family protein [Tautonia plasticadhaerens]QDV37457.1 Caspase domain protein [Tautonia plasticadhaerens]
MNRTLYALLVGIDNYPEPRHRLNGCINDITRIREYLDARYRKDAGFTLAPPVVLTDAQATRQAVVDAFRGHLGQAKKGDVALFYYSGHGSQERAPKEFWHLEPDKLDETLVCYDSRMDGPGHHDLADKELAYLIEQVAKPGGHVVVVLDCCHSGSGTRDLRVQQTAVRRMETDLRERPLDTFIMTVQDADRLSRGADGGVGADSGWSAAGAHVLLAACRDDEEAVEYHAEGPDGRVEPRGTFSYFLGDALRTITGPITYRELFARTEALVRSRVPGQTPQIESIPAGNLDLELFDGAIRPTLPFYTLSQRDGQWRIDGGAVHGLPAVDPTDPTLLEVFPFGVPDDDLRTASKALRRVTLSRVEPTSSVVEGGEALDPEQAYKAVIAAMPLPRIGVVFELPDSDGAKLAIQALATARDGSQPSLYVREAGIGAIARFRLLAEGGGYVITSPESDRPLVARIEGQTPATARLAFQRLEHMAKWILASELSNPNTSVQPEDVVLELLDADGQPLPGPSIRLEYQLDTNGKWQPPRFKIRLVNKTGYDLATGVDNGRVLYCGLLDLTDTFAISPLLEAGYVRLGPGESYEAFQGKFVEAKVPDKVWQQGIVEYKDVLKLIVCTKEFNTHLMRQGPLDLPGTKSTTRGITRRGSLNRLMDRLQTREIGVVSEGEDLDDWWATQVIFTTVRPLEAAPVPNAPGRSVALAGGVRLLDHPALKASARLSPAPAASRDLGNLALPRLLRDDPTVSLPFPLAVTRGNDPTLSALILTDVRDDSHREVTPETPLKLQVPRGLADGEYVLPVGFDGEFFLPLGRAERTSAGSTELILERLPDPTSGGKKSLGGSIRIFFQKIVGPWLGSPSPYPILAAAQVGADGVVESTRDVASVAQLVAGAKTILLYVHGIIGDTREMASSALRGGFADRYDLVLTFDYENLNTTIAENARLLGERLKAVGLGAGHGKQLDVVAHSMGGLVSRWFIEREGGNKVARRLVMLGTPNAGSPWPRVVDWATAALALGLNGLTGTPWAASVLGGLVAAGSDPRVTLREMLPGSETLTAMGQDGDPGIPYTILAGNTSIIPAAREDGGPVSRLMARIFGTQALYRVANPFFLGSPNDVAVAIASMTQLGPGRAPLVPVETECDHLTYFRSPAGLASLDRALTS